MIALYIQERELKFLIRCFIFFVMLLGLPTYVNTTVYDLQSIEASELDVTKVNLTNTSNIDRPATFVLLSGCIANISEVWSKILWIRADHCCLNNAFLQLSLPLLFQHTWFIWVLCNGILFSRLRTFVT